MFTYQLFFCVSDPPSINDLLNTYDQFDPEPILQRAVAAKQRVDQYVNDAPRYRRPQTALADPFPSSNRPQTNQRRGSTGNPSQILDLNDFPSTNRSDPYAIRQRYPNGPTADPKTGDYTISPRPTHRTVSLPQNDRFLTVNVPKVDTSALDSVLHSPGRGSEPPVHLQRPRTQDDFFTTSPLNRRRLDLEGDYYSDDPMSKASPNWKNSFGNMREKFGPNTDFSDADDDPIFRSAMTMPRNGQRIGNNFLTKSASQNTLDHSPNE